MNRDMLEAAQEYLGLGHKVALLNMASLRQPGGGVEHGAGAQEENLHRRSDCSRFLWEQRARCYPIPDDACLLSEQVTVFRGTEECGYPLLKEPFRISVVSCAAINRPRLRGREYADLANSTLMRCKIELILEGVVELGCDLAILCAFGCGAFCNPPSVVARMFQEAIAKANLQEAVFCVYDDHDAGGKHKPQGVFQTFSDTFYGRGASPGRLYASQASRSHNVMPDVEIWAGTDFQGGVERGQHGIDLSCMLPEPSSLPTSEKTSCCSPVRGFENLGNDCWMIAAVQLLNSAPRFVELFMGSSDNIGKSHIQAMRTDFSVGTDGEPCPICMTRLMIG
jgi:uncharacterized protein (TIGR02452 family)